MNHWELGFFPCTAPLARPLTAAAPPRGTCPALAFSPWAQPGRDRFLHILLDLHESSLQEELETPEASHGTALVWEPWLLLLEVLAAVPALGSFSSGDVPVQKLQVIYSSCLGKHHLCKWVFLENQEIWESSGTPG